jgi:hypothetical protein
MQRLQNLFERQMLFGMRCLYAQQLMLDFASAVHGPGGRLGFFGALAVAFADPGAGLGLGGDCKPFPVASM